MHGGPGNAHEERGGGAPALQPRQISSFSPLQGSDLAVPAQRPRSFNSQHPQGVLLIQSGGTGLGPEIQLADTHDRIRTEPRRHAGGSQRRPKRGAGGGGPVRTRGRRGGGGGGLQSSAGRWIHLYTM